MILVLQLIVVVHINSYFRKAKMWVFKLNSWYSTLLVNTCAYTLYMIPILSDELISFHIRIFSLLYISDEFNLSIWLTILNYHESLSVLIESVWSLFLHKSSWFHKLLLIIWKEVCCLIWYYSYLDWNYSNEFL
jgi:hypothetical protein